MRWPTATLLYVCWYGVLTAADFFTTNAGVQSGAGRELNEVVVDRTTEGLSVTFVALQMGFAGLCGWVFASGYRLLESEGPPGRYNSLAVLFGLTRSAGDAAVRNLLGTVTILGMKTVVAVSNVGLTLAGWSVFGAIRALLGGDAALAWLVLAACVAVAAAAGFLIAVPVVRWIVGRAPG